MTNQIPQSPPVDLDVLQESALAMAQATIQNAMDHAKMKPVQLARNMGQHRSFVSRMLSGRHNMTVKTFALAMAGCGYRLQFSYAPIRWGWAAEKPAMPAPPIPQKQSSVPTPVGTLVGMIQRHSHWSAHRTQ